MAEKKAWVSSRGSYPVHLVDWSVIVERDNVKDYQRVEITKEMAENHIPIEVVNSMFIQGYYSDHIALLELWHDIVAAKKANEDYFKDRKEVVKAEEASKREIDDANEKAILAARKEFDRVIKAAQDKRAPKPKVIRTRDIESD